MSGCRARRREPAWSRARFAIRDFRRRHGSSVLQGKLLVLCTTLDPERASGFASASAEVVQMAASIAGSVELAAALATWASARSTNCWLNAAPGLAGALLSAGLADELVLYLGANAAGVGLAQASSICRRRPRWPEASRAPPSPSGRRWATICSFACGRGVAGGAKGCRTGIVQGNRRCRGLQAATGQRRLSVETGRLATSGWRVGDSVSAVSQRVCLTIVRARRRALRAPNSPARRRCARRSTVSRRVPASISSRRSRPWMRSARAVRHGSRGWNRASDRVGARSPRVSLSAAIEARVGLARFIARKGSVALDGGLSLTVGEIDGAAFRCRYRVSHARDDDSRPARPGQALDLEIDPHRHATSNGCWRRGKMP